MTGSLHKSRHNDVTGVVGWFRVTDFKNKVKVEEFTNLRAVMSERSLRVAGKVPNYASGL